MSSIREALGSWMGLRLRTARRPVLLGPAWAALCGIVASGQAALTAQDVLLFVLTLFLTDSLLGGVWSAVADLQSSHRSHRSAPSNPDPATKSNPGSHVPTVLPVTVEPLGRTGRALGDAEMRSAVVEFLWALAPALAIALLLSRAVAVIVLGAVILSLLRWLWQGPKGVRAPSQRALLEIALGWLVGYLAFIDPGLLSQPTFYGAGFSLWPAWEHFGAGPWFLAGTYAAAYYAALTLDKRRRLTEKLVLLMTPQVLVAGFLIAKRRPESGAAVLLLLFGQMLFQPYLRRYREHIWYLRNTQYYLMGSMLAAALGLAGWTIL